MLEEISYAIDRCRNQFRVSIVSRMEPVHSGQLLFVNMRSSAPESCASASIVPSLLDRPPPAAGGPAYLEEVLRDREQ